MSRPAPVLGEVREPRQTCEGCGVKLTETCRHCWECARHDALEERRDAGPSTAVDPYDS